MGRRVRARARICAYMSNPVLIRAGMPLTPYVFLRQSSHYFRADHTGLHRHRRRVVSRPCSQKPARVARVTQPRPPSTCALAHLPRPPVPHHSTDSFFFSSGIGLETALQFAAEGARVVLADINEPAVVKAAEAVRGAFPSSEAVGVKCDVSKESEVKAVVDKAVEAFGRLDVLVSVVRGRGWGRGVGVSA